MDDANRVKLSYEELGRPEVDQALTEIKKQRKRAAVRANAGVKDARVRALKRLLFLILAALLGLFLVLSLLYFGRSLISGKSDSSKSRLEQKSVRI